METLAELRAYLNDDENREHVGFEDLDGQPSATAIRDLLVEAIELGIERMEVHPVSVLESNREVAWEQGAFRVRAFGNEYEIVVTRRT